MRFASQKKTTEVTRHLGRLNLGNSRVARLGYRQRNSNHLGPPSAFDALERGYDQSSFRCVTSRTDILMNSLHCRWLGILQSKNAHANRRSNGASLGFRGAEKLIGDELLRIDAVTSNL